MIILTELEFGNWGHYEVNCGMLHLFSTYAKKTRDKVLFVASKYQIECIMEEKPENVSFYEIEILNYGFKSEYEKKEYYRQLFKKIFINQLNLTEKDQLFILTTRSGILAGIVEANRQYNLYLNFILHGDLDAILRNAEQEQHYIDLINNAAKKEFTRFFCYSPYAKEQLKSIMNIDFINKLCFIHHPFINYGKKLKHPELSEKIIIGAYGACVNKNYSKLLHKVHFDDVSFLSFRSVIYNKRKLDIRYDFPKEGIELHQSLKGYSKEQCLEFIQRMEWGLLTYSKDMYVVSMSGILADLIRYEKPFIALSSPAIRYYCERWGIGIVLNTVEEMADYINKELPKVTADEYDSYVRNMKILKKETFMENMVILENILGGERDDRRNTSGTI